MKRKSEAALGTVFYVPNDEKGRAFIKDLRHYMNRGVYKMRLRGRNPNRQQFAGTKARAGYFYGAGSLRQSIPACLASYFAVYLDCPAAAAINDKRYRDLYQQLEAARNAVRTLSGFDNQLAARLDAKLDGVETKLFNFKRRILVK